MQASKVDYNGKKGRIPGWAKEYAKAQVDLLGSFEEAYADFLGAQDAAFKEAPGQQVDRAFRKYAEDNGCYYTFEDEENEREKVDLDKAFEEFLDDFRAAVTDAECDVEAVTNLMNMGYHK